MGSNQRWFLGLRVSAAWRRPKWSMPLNERERTGERFGDASAAANLPSLFAPNYDTVRTQLIAMPRV
jgi:hypothetical protein